MTMNRGCRRSAHSTRHSRRAHGPSAAPLSAPVPGRSARHRIAAPGSGGSSSTCSSCRSGPPSPPPSIGASGTRKPARRCCTGRAGRPSCCSSSCPTSPSASACRSAIRPCAEVLSRDDPRRRRSAHRAADVSAILRHDHGLGDRRALPGPDEGTARARPCASCRPITSIPLISKPCGGSSRGTAASYPGSPTTTCSAFTASRSSTPRPAIPMRRTSSARPAC